MNKALPEKIPEPTWTPAAVAFGVTLVFWGMVTSPLISASGIVVIAIGLTFWIGDMCRE
jgi:hypothetical protein